MKFAARFTTAAAFILAATLASLLAPTAAAQPRHVYLTYSGAPETSVDVNLLLKDRVPTVDVYYDTEPRLGKTNEYRNHAQADYHQSLMELSDGRALYVAALATLKPGAVYYFIAGDAKGGFTQERKLRTLPGRDAAIRFVDGGDMGVDGRVVPLLTLAAKESPDFAVIGGDIAYANTLGEFDKWDRWLKNWDEHMVTPDGRMVPIVAAVGNHEVTRFSSREAESRSPWYVGLFGRQGPEIYHTFRVGDNVVFFLLDTGHLNPYEGPQTGWLAQELAKYKDLHYKFASYHVPLYPAHREYDGEDSKRGRAQWGPLFDQFGLTVAFEHHDHVFKRSKPLKGNQVVEHGTIYVGDGCFGRDPRTVDPKPRWYNEIEKSAANFWVVDVSKNGLQFKAIGEDGTALDHFSLP
jgi:hypothetical protein